MPINNETLQAKEPHTPVPWAYDENDARIYYADSDVEPTIAYIERDNTSPERVKADGYLIAAAPAQALLLDLVRYGVVTITDGDVEFQETVYAYDSSTPDWNALIEAIGWDNAHAAIAKAEGIAG